MNKLEKEINDFPERFEQLDGGFNWRELSLYSASKVNIINTRWNYDNLKDNLIYMKYYVNDHDRWYKELIRRKEGAAGQPKPEKTKKEIILEKFGCNREAVEELLELLGL